MRIVADTNIFISALMFGGLPGLFLDRALMQSFLLVTSPALLDELVEKLIIKFAVSPEDAGRIRAKLEVCAITGQANCIVRGDRHLLKLGAYDNMPILTVRQFMDTFEANA